MAYLTDWWHSLQQNLRQGQDHVYKNYIQTWTMEAGKYMIIRKWTRIDPQVKMEEDKCSFSVLNCSGVTLLWACPPTLPNL